VDLKIKSRSDKWYSTYHKLKGKYQYIVQAYLSGKSCTDLANELGVDYRTIQYHIHKAGVMRSRSDAIRLASSQGKAVGFSWLKDRYGENNPYWKGGRHGGNGDYVFIWIPKLRKYVREHRLVWEQTHGKKLPRGWCVHHLNGIFSDNRPENLIAMSMKSHDNYIPKLKEQIRSLEVENARLRRQLEEVM